MPGCLAGWLAACLPACLLPGTAASVSMHALTSDNHTRSRGDRSSTVKDKQDFTRHLAATGGARARDSSTGGVRGGAPTLTAAEQQEQLLREDSGAQSTAGARARAQIAYAKRAGSGPPTPHRV